MNCVIINVLAEHVRLNGQHILVKQNSQTPTFILLSKIKESI